MLVIKRDNTMVEFDKSKIEIAILKAMKYGSGVYDKDIATKIANEIEHEMKYAHHHHEEECCCGHHHEHHHHEEECCCGHHHEHQHHEEECCCGHHHEHQHRSQG